jgi:hypothetical protein
MKQMDIIKKTNWDILVILDACRIDAFHNILMMQDNKFSNYLKKTFKHFDYIFVNSEVSDTMEWLEYHWNDYHDDIFYISGNPHVNSHGIGHYDARKHFRKILDAWDTGFSKSTQRIEPMEILKMSNDIIDSYTEFNKFIIHFMQPHSPYIFDKKKLTINDLIDKMPKGSYRIYNFFRMNKIINRINMKYFKGAALLENQYSKVYDNKEIINAYNNNLKTLIDPLYNLLTKYKYRNIIITADHGELLGEYGRYGHGGKLVPELTNVPFLYIRGRR